MKGKVIKRIKSKTTEGLAARTDILLVTINGEDTIHIVQTMLSKKLFNPLEMHPIAKRGDVIIYRTGIAFRQSTLLYFYGYLKETIEPYDNNK